MPDDTPKTATLVLDGKKIDIKTDQADGSKLSAALKTADNFKKFAANPSSFAKDFGLQIDDQISAQLSKKLAGFSTIDDAMAMTSKGSTEATAWAVAEGVYSIASTKIAVAF